MAAVVLPGILGCSMPQPSEQPSDDGGAPTGPLPKGTLPAAPAGADDWPQWQGSDRNAISKQKGLLQEWPKDGPPLAWKTKGLGGGDSAPSVACGGIFGMSNRGDDEVVWALSEAAGKELWLTRLGPAFQQLLPHSKEVPSCTPPFAVERLSALGLGGALAFLQ